MWGGNVCMQVYVHREARGGHQMFCCISLHLTPCRQCLSLILTAVQLGWLANTLLLSSHLHPSLSPSSGVRAHRAVASFYVDARDSNSNP